MTTRKVTAAAVVGTVVLLTAAPTQLAAQQSASATAMLEELVVTARRRDESPEVLPLSFQALSGDAMRVLGIYDIKDIAMFVPNVAFRDLDRRGRGSIFIRGVGASGPGNYAPVGAGLYLDGHYLPGNNNRLLSTLDMERVEVLRGPQGTLFGKNTTGGAIQFITAKPRPDFESEILLRAAQFGQQDFRGMINVPINDTLAARVAVAKETTDGYYYNRTLNRDYGGIDVDAISAALRITPTDNWTVDLLFRGNYDDSENLGGTCKVYPRQAQIDALVADGQIPVDPFGNPYVAAPAGGVSAWGGFAGGIGNVERIYPGAVLDFWDNCTIDNATDDFTTSAEKDGFVKQETEFYSVTSEWDSNGAIGNFENVNVKIIGGRHVTDYNNWGDLDFTPLSIDASGTYLGPGSERATESLELLFTAAVSDRVSFTAGAHYFYDLAELGEQGCRKTIRANFAELSDPNSGFEIPCSFDGGLQFDRLGDNLAGNGSVGLSARSGFVEAESIAAYGHMTFAINDDWTLDLGARWTEEDRAFNSAELNTVPGTCVHNPPHYLNNPSLTRAPTTGPSNPGAPARTEMCQPDYLLTHESVFVDGYYFDEQATFSATTPMVSLTRTLQPNGVLDSGMFYGTIAEGFLTGAFNNDLNVNLVPELAPLLTYDPEYVINYELGFKGTLADGRLRLATALFFMDYTDKQEEIEIDNSDQRYGSDQDIEIVSNVATMDIYGIELELRAQPWDGGFVSVDVGYLQAEYGRFTSFDPDQPGGTIDRSNLTIEDYSPEWTITAAVEHAFVLGNGATLTPQLGMYWQSEYDFIGGIDADGPPSICLQDAFASFRARVTYEPPDARWQASLFGTNIFDERFFDNCDTARGGVYDYRYARPETWGAEFVYRWGG